MSAPTMTSLLVEAALQLPSEREKRLEALLRECGHTFNCIRNQPTTTRDGERIHTYGLATQIEQELGS